MIQTLYAHINKRKKTITEKKKKTTNADKDVGERNEHSHTVGGNVN
jgi:hypothetical protein